MTETIIICAFIALGFSWIAATQAAKNKEGGAARDSREDAADKVCNILGRVYREMLRQKMPGCGPWIPAALEKRCADPAVALTAIRWTLREMEEAPVGDGVGYIPGLVFRFDLGPLQAAAEELEGMVVKRK